jgi:hypothetical protein
MTILERYSAQNRALKPIRDKDHGGEELGYMGESGGSEAGEPSTLRPP